MDIDNAHIEQQSLMVQRFLWTAGNYKLPAGDLLGIILRLLQTQFPSVFIDNDEIANYLLANNYIAAVAPKQYAVIQGKQKALTVLGNEISRFVDSTISALPINTEIKLIPNIHVL